MKLTICMEPKAKSRARTVRVNGRTMTFTPSATVNAETEIKVWLIGHAGAFGPGVPLRLTAIFYRSKPKSCPKRQQFPTQKFDLDNAEKLLCDAMNRLVYPDDSQIVTKLTAKRFADQPRIELELVEEHELMPACMA